MTYSDRTVFDTNVLISALLLPESLPRQAVDLALEFGTLLISEATLRELAAVLKRPRFDSFVTHPEREVFLRRLASVAEWVEPSLRLAVCRDPKDDKFLELAVDGRADVVVTGDKDLLVLNPFRGIGVMTPAQFLGQ